MSTKQLPTFLAATFAATVLCAVPAASALDGSAPPYDSRVRILALNADSARGSVVSEHRYCTKRRRVVLYRVGEEGRYDRLVGGDNTNRRGNWRIESRSGEDLGPGRYYGMTLYRPLDGGNHCREHTSKPKRLGT